MVWYTIGMLKNQEHLELLEDLPLQADDLWYILLVYLGLKSGAWVHLQSDVWREGGEAKRVSSSKVRDIEKTLETLGLTYIIDTRDTIAGIPQPDNGRKRYNQIVDIYVAADESVVNDIVRARTENDHKLLGRALGYPASAVNAFGTEEKIFVSDLDPKIQLSEVGQLTYFVLSKGGWREELAVVEKWVEAAKQSSIIWDRLRSFAHLVDNDLIDLAVRAQQKISN